MYRSTDSTNSTWHAGGQLVSSLAHWLGKLSQSVCLRTAISTGQSPVRLVWWSARCRLRQLQQQLCLLFVWQNVNRVNIIALILHDLLSYGAYICLYGLLSSSMFNMNAIRKHDHYPSIKNECKTKITVMIHWEIQFACNDANYYSIIINII